MAFRDRADAGQQLAAELHAYAGRPDVLVLALPRGGVPVGHEVARALQAPLDVFLVRKLGLPGQEELAMGAVATGGVRVLNEELVQRLSVPPEVIDAAVERALPELEQGEQSYRGDRPPREVRERTVILIDDGLATGSTMRAAVAALRRLGPKVVIVAVPVGAAETCTALRALADDVICLRTPEPFYAVGLWYTRFGQTSDEEVRKLLADAEHAG